VISDNLQTSYSLPSAGLMISIFKSLKTLTPNEWGIGIIQISYKVYHVDLGDRGMVTEVPKKVRDLEERLGLDIFPKVIRS